jgi:hypothetical protein
MHKKQAETPLAWGERAQCHLLAAVGHLPTSANEGFGEVNLTLPLGALCQIENSS